MKGYLSRSSNTLLSWDWLNCEVSKFSYQWIKSFDIRKLKCAWDCIAQNSTTCYGTFSLGIIETSVPQILNDRSLFQSLNLTFVYSTVWKRVVSNHFLQIANKQEKSNSVNSFFPASCTCEVSTQNVHNLPYKFLVRHRQIRMKTIWFSTLSLYYPELYEIARYVADTNALF